VLADYRSPDAFDELVNHLGPAGHRSAQGPAQALADHLDALGADELALRQELANRSIEAAGISFTVYSDGVGIDRAWPFDIVPRIIEGREWDRIEAGLVQRLTALNRFLADIYGPRHCLADGVVPADVVLGSKGYRPECDGIQPAGGVWAHVCGSDLVRDRDGVMYVLEDNLRVPSGASYVLCNRQVTKRVFAELFANQSIRPVDAYPDRLLRVLGSCAPTGATTPNVVLLTPGIYNSAYFEHAFLARQMGIGLMEGQDLFVEDHTVYAYTIDGPVRVDVIYRRIDDLFLDPAVFRPDSLLGVPGLMGAWRRGNVALANAPGTGVADDKAVYAFVPALIRYYLGQEPILANVPTWWCGSEHDRAEVLARLPELVVKPTGESGGYGIVIGPTASSEELAACAERIKADPAGWVAQETIQLSTVPTWCDGTLAARHVDLRPFTLAGRDSYVTCGGLTRVARQAGSLVVNSSQGGGSKDTWVIDLPPDDDGPPGVAASGSFEAGVAT
jgi:uncharacterized circularly permuted ATP-grasp superfamily protein